MTIELELECIFWESSCSRVEGCQICQDVYVFGRYMLSFVFRNDVQLLAPMPPLKTCKSILLLWTEEANELRRKNAQLLRSAEKSWSSVGVMQIRDPFFVQWFTVRKSQRNWMKHMEDDIAQPSPTLHYKLKSWKTTIPIHYHPWNNHFFRPWKFAIWKAPQLEALVAGMSSRAKALGVFCLIHQVGVFPMFGGREISMPWIFLMIFGYPKNPFTKKRRFQNNGFCFFNVSKPPEKNGKNGGVKIWSHLIHIWGSEVGTVQRSDLQGADAVCKTPRCFDRFIPNWKLAEFAPSKMMLGRLCAFWHRLIFGWGGICFMWCQQRGVRFCCLILMP